MKLMLDILCLFVIESGSFAPWAAVKFIPGSNHTERR